MRITSGRLATCFVVARVRDLSGTRKLMKRTAGNRRSPDNPNAKGGNSNQAGLALAGAQAGPMINSEMERGTDRENPSSPDCQGEISNNSGHEPEDSGALKLRLSDSLPELPRLKLRQYAPLGCSYCHNRNYRKDDILNTDSSYFRSDTILRRMR